MKGGLGWAILIMVALGVASGVTGIGPDTLSAGTAWLVFGPAWLIGTAVSYVRQKPRPH